MSSQNPAPWWRRLLLSIPSPGGFETTEAEDDLKVDSPSRRQEPPRASGEQRVNSAPSHPSSDSASPDGSPADDFANAFATDRRNRENNSDGYNSCVSHLSSDQGIAVPEVDAESKQDHPVLDVAYGHTDPPQGTAYVDESGEPDLTRDDLAAISEKYDTTRAQLDQAKAQLDEFATQINALRDEVQKHKLRAKRANVKIAQTQEALRERTSRFSDQNDKLKSTITELRTKVVTVNERAGQNRQRMNERLERSSAQITKLKETLQEQRTRTVVANERTLEARKLMAERSTLLKERLSVSREKLVVKNSLYNAARRYYAIYRQGLLLDEALKSEEDFSADAYFCLLPSTVPAGLTLSRLYGGRVYCDCVENVEVHKHSLAPNVHKPTLELINLSAFGSLMSVDGIMTVGNALARTLHRFGPPVHVAPNFRRYEEPIPANELREACGLGDDEKLLFASGNVVVGFEPVIRALAELPDNVHLAAFVKLKPDHYESEMLSLIEELGIADRIHFFDFVPYDKLASIAADADVGMITSDITNPNGAVALPNRLFDYVTAGLPVIAPPMPDVVDIVHEHGLGVTLEEVTAENWVHAIRTVLDNHEAYREAAIAARRVLNWENGEDDIVRFLGNPSSVTLLGFRDLSRYQRFLRITQALTSRGIKVKALFLSDDPAPVPFEGAEFYSFSDRYGLGDGPVRVPPREA